MGGVVGGKQAGKLLLLALGLLALPEVNGLGSGLILLTEPDEEWTVPS